MRKYGALVVAICIGVVCALGVAVLRMRVEARLRQVAITMDGTDVKNLAAQLGMSPLRVLRRLRAAGLTAVAVPLPTVGDLVTQGQASVRTGQDLLTLASLTSLRDSALATLVREGRIQPSLTYFFTTRPSVMREVEAALRVQLSPGAKAMPLLSGPSGPQLLATTLSQGALEAVQLPLDPAFARAIREAGLRLIVRVGNPVPPNPREVAYLLGSLRGVRRPVAVIFSGTSALGYPSELRLVARWLNRLDIPLGSIEFTNQRGVNQLAAMTDYRVVKVFSLPSAYAAKLQIAGIVPKMARAAHERNVRVLYLHTIPPESPSVDPLTENARLVAAVRAAILPYGLHTGAPQTFAPFAYPRLLLVGMSLGIWAGAVWLLDLLWPQPERRLRVLEGLALLAALGVFGAGINLAREALSLLAALVYPTLGMVAATRHVRRPEGSGLAQAYRLWLEASGITLIGALLVQGVLAGVPYFLELKTFVGVKLEFTVPLLVFALYYLAAAGGGLDRVARAVWRSEVRVSYIVIALVAALVAVVYITRTGNSPVIGASSLELAMRGALSQLLTVRPRTKEFLIGHPLFLLGISLLARRRRSWALPCLLLGAAGQVDMVDTFAHLHIPFVISALRTVLGLVLGAAVGLVLLWLVGLCGGLGMNAAEEPVDFRAGLATRSESAARRAS